MGNQLISSTNLGLSFMCRALPYDQGQTLCTSNKLIKDFEYLNPSLHDNNMPKYRFVKILNEFFYIVEKGFDLSVAYSNSDNERTAGNGDLMSSFYSGTYGYSPGMPQPTNYQAPGSNGEAYIKDRKIDLPETAYLIHQTSLNIIAKLMVFDFISDCKNINIYNYLKYEDNALIRRYLNACSINNDILHIYNGSRMKQSNYNHNIRISEKQTLSALFIEDINSRFVHPIEEYTRLSIYEKYNKELYYGMITHAFAIDTTYGHIVLPEMYDKVHNVSEQIGNSVDYYKKDMHKISKFISRISTHIAINENILDASIVQSDKNNIIGIFTKENNNCKLHYNATTLPNPDYLLSKTSIRGNRYHSVGKYEVAELDRIDTIDNLFFISVKKLKHTEENKIMFYRRCGLFRAEFEGNEIFPITGTIKFPIIKNQEEDTIKLERLFTKPPEEETTRLFCVNETSINFDKNLTKIMNYMDYFEFSTYQNRRNNRRSLRSILTTCHLLPDTLLTSLYGEAEANKFIDLNKDNLLLHPELVNINLYFAILYTYIYLYNEVCTIDAGGYSEQDIHTPKSPLAKELFEIIMHKMNLFNMFMDRLEESGNILGILSKEYDKESILKRGEILQKTCKDAISIKNKNGSFSMPQISYTSSTYNIYQLELLSKDEDKGGALMDAFINYSILNINIFNRDKEAIIANKVENKSERLLPTNFTHALSPYDSFTEHYFKLGSEF